MAAAAAFFIPPAAVLQGQAFCILCKAFVMSNKIDFAAIAAAALSDATRLLSGWLPDGKRKGHEFVAANPTRADRHAGSFSVNLNNGKWADFATGDAGGDLVSLYAYLFGLDNGKAARELAELLRLPESTVSAAPVAVSAPSEVKAENESVWETIVPVPERFCASMLAEHGFRADDTRESVSVYRDAVGEVLGAVVRFRRSGGGKADLPRTFCRNRETGVMAWRWRFWDGLRPLYGLDALAAKPDAPVLIVEGEKCKNAADASGLFDDFAVLTWPGGGGNWHKADWSAVVGRRVVLWPDADAQREKLSKAEREQGMDPDSKPLLDLTAQPGFKAMAGLADCLRGQGCTCYMVEIPFPGVWPSGYDIADALADGGVHVDVSAAVRSAVLWSQQTTALPPEPANVEAAPEQNDDKGAGEDDGGESRYQANLETLKREFALVEGKDRAVHKTKGVEYSRRALMAHFCRESVENWLNWGRAPVFTHFEINEIKRIRQQRELEQDKAVLDMMARYVYLDGSASIWDNELWRMIDQSSAKLAMGDAFKIWLNHPQRIVKRFEHVVFEPGVDVPEHYINIYRGLPLMDKVSLLDKMSLPSWWMDICKQFPECYPIMGLLSHLCNHDYLQVEFLLNWLAYPLQHPGAKMTTAIVMHGDVHGAGKSLFFESIIKPMYGNYAITLGQRDLESSYTGNRSGKLFVLFEEIFNNKQKYDQTGAMKHMITGKTQRVERKFVDAYEEANHINCVFLSNEAQPFKIEEKDRRYFVVWPQKKLPEKIKAEVTECLGKGGIEAFFAYLMGLPLTLNYEYVENDDPSLPAKVQRLAVPVRFDPHTVPPMTVAKQNVINYGRYGWQTFFAEWEAGEIEGIPFCSCQTKDVWRLFKWWCRENNEREVPKPRLLQNIATKMPRARRWWRLPHSPTPDKKWMNEIFNPSGVRPPDGVCEMDFIGPQVLRFTQAVDDLLAKKPH